MIFKSSISWKNNYNTNNYLKKKYLNLFSNKQYCDSIMKRNIQKLNMDQRYSIILLIINNIISIDNRIYLNYQDLFNKHIIELELDLVKLKDFYNVTFERDIFIKKNLNSLSTGQVDVMISFIYEYLELFKLNNNTDYIKSLIVLIHFSTGIPTTSIETAFRSHKLMIESIHDKKIEDRYNNGCIVICLIMCLLSLLFFLFDNI